MAGRGELRAGQGAREMGAWAQDAKRGVVRRMRGKGSPWQERGRRFLGDAGCVKASTSGAFCFRARLNECHLCTLLPSAPDSLCFTRSLDAWESYSATALLRWVPALFRQWPCYQCSPSLVAAAHASQPSQQGTPAYEGPSHSTLWCTRDSRHAPLQRPHNASLSGVLPGRRPSGVLPVCQSLCQHTLSQTQPAQG